MNRLIAVDPSLSSSGWVLFSVANGEMLDIGVLSPPPPSQTISERLASLQEDVDALFSNFDLGAKDVLVCEGPAPLVLNPHSSLKVEQVRGVFEGVARGKGVSVPGRINPRTVQTELLGMQGAQKGRAEVKKVARHVAEQLFGDQLNALWQCKKKLSQDVIDAALIGCLALSRIRLAEQTQQSLVSVFSERMGAGNARNTRSRSVSSWRNVSAKKLLG